MKKVIGLLVKTPKNLYGKKKKHVYWVTIKKHVGDDVGKGMVMESL
jgi:hypothetical protein